MVAPRDTCGSVRESDFGPGHCIIDCGHLERIPRKRLQVLEDPGELFRPLLVLRDEVRDLAIDGPREGIYYRVGVIRSSLRLSPVTVQVPILLLLLDGKHHGS